MATQDIVSNSQLLGRKLLPHSPLFFVLVTLGLKYWFFKPPPRPCACLLALFLDQIVRVVPISVTPTVARQSECGPTFNWLGTKVILSSTKVRTRIGLNWVEQVFFVKHDRANVDWLELQGHGCYLWGIMAWVRSLVGTVTISIVPRVVVDKGTEWTWRLSVRRIFGSMEFDLQCNNFKSAVSWCW